MALFGIQWSSRKNSFNTILTTKSNPSLLCLDIEVYLITSKYSSPSHTFKGWSDFVSPLLFFFFRFHSGLGISPFSRRICCSLPLLPPSLCLLSAALRFFAPSAVAWWRVSLVWDVWITVSQSRVIPGCFSEGKCSSWIKQLVLTTVIGGRVAFLILPC